MSETFTLNVRQVDDHFEVAIPEIDETVTASTYEGALDASQQAIARWHMHADMNQRDQAASHARINQSPIE